MTLRKINCIIYKVYREYRTFIIIIVIMFQGHIAPTEHSMLRSREGISNGGQDVTSAATPRHDTSRQMTSYDASAPSRGPVVDDVHSTKDAHAAIETDDNETNTTAEDFSHLSVSCKPCDSDEGLLSKDVT